MVGGRYKVYALEKESILLQNHEVEINIGISYVKSVTISMKTKSQENILLQNHGHLHK